MCRKRRPPKRRRGASLPPMTRIPRNQRYARRNRHFNNRSQQFFLDEG